MLYITLNLGTAAVMINLDVYIDNTLTTIVSLRLFSWSANFRYFRG